MSVQTGFSLSGHGYPVIQREIRKEDLKSVRCVSLNAFFYTILYCTS